MSGGAWFRKFWPLHIFNCFSGLNYVWKTAFSQSYHGTASEVEVFFLFNIIIEYSEIDDKFNSMYVQTMDVMNYTSEEDWDEIAFSWWKWLQLKMFEIYVR